MSNPFTASRVRWYQVVNLDTEPAPPFGIMGAVGCDALGRIQVKRPTMSSQAGLLVNGPGQIPSGFGGQAHQTWPAIVAYDIGGDDDADTPQAGEQWGSLVDGVHNAWKLAPGQSGFAILGGAVSGKVMATAAGVMQSFAAISSSTQSSVQLFDGTKINAYPANLQESFTGDTPPAGDLVWTNAAAAIWLVDINGGTLSTGQQYACRFIGQDVNGVQIWSPLVSSGSQAWVKATSSTASTINLGREVTDAVENGTTTLTSASAKFTSGDVGATLIGTNIPSSPPTTISSVTNSTTVVMSAAATASASGVTVQIVTGTTTGYAAVIDSWSNKTGNWSDGTVVWLIGVNTESFSSGRRYQCRYMGTDDNNVQIWATSLAIPYLTTSTGSGSLATSWTTILSLTLPANTTWKLETQLTASLASSASGAFDYLSARYYDGSTVYGVVADFCYAACDSITVPGTVCVQTVIAVGGTALTIDVQTQINTSSGSTASLVGAEFDAFQLQ